MNNIEIPEGYVTCPECQGGQFTMKCYGGHPIEVKCDICDGEGIIYHEE